MIKNNQTGPFDFEDNSYVDNYENNGYSENYEEVPTNNNLFETNNTNNLFETNDTPYEVEDDFFGVGSIDSNSSANSFGATAPFVGKNGVGQNFQNQANYQQNQGNVKVNNFKQQVGQVVENGGVELKGKHAGILVFIVGAIVILIIIGVHNFVNRPKAVKNTAPISTEVPVNATTGQKASKEVNSNITTLDLILVDSDVKVDYTSAFIETTGLLTNKHVFVKDNQLYYCFDISMTVGSNTKLVRHFCNRKLYDTLDTGTVVKVTYQQVDANNISIYDITM